MSRSSSTLCVYFGRVRTVPAVSPFVRNIEQTSFKMLRQYFTTCLNSSSLTQKQRHEFYWCSRAFYDCARDVAWQDIVPMDERLVETVNLIVTNQAEEA